MRSQRQGAIDDIGAGLQDQPRFTSSARADSGSRQAVEMAGYRTEPAVGCPSAKTSAITQQPFRAIPKAMPTRV